MDRGFRRMAYTRYGSTCLVTVVASRKEAETVRDTLMGLVTRHGLATFQNAPPQGPRRGPLRGPLPKPGWAQDPWVPAPGHGAVPGRRVWGPRGAKGAGGASKPPATALTPWHPGGRGRLPVLPIPPVAALAREGVLFLGRRIVQRPPVMAAPASRAPRGPGPRDPEGPRRRAGVSLRVPVGALIDGLRSRGFFRGPGANPAQGKGFAAQRAFQPTAQRAVVNRRHGAILAVYRRVGRGLMAYYRRAANRRALGALLRGLTHSCALTLALKGKARRAAQAYRAYGPTLAVPGRPATALTWTPRRPSRCPWPQTRIRPEVPPRTRRPATPWASGSAHGGEAEAESGSEKAEAAPGSEPGSEPESEGAEAEGLTPGQALALDRVWSVKDTWTPRSGGRMVRKGPRPMASYLGLLVPFHRPRPTPRERPVVGRVPASNGPQRPRLGGPKGSKGPKGVGRVG